MRGSEASGEATRGNLRPGISIDSTSCPGLFPKKQEGGGGKANKTVSEAS